MQSHSDDKKESEHNGSPTPEADEPSLLGIDSGDEHSPISVKDVLEDLSPPRSRRPSMHDLQQELDTVLRDVTNMVDSCLVSPFIPKKPVARKPPVIRSAQL